MYISGVSLHQNELNRALVTGSLRGIYETRTKNVCHFLFVLSRGCIRSSQNRAKYEADSSRSSTEKQGVCRPGHTSTKWHILDHLLGISSHKYLENTHLFQDRVDGKTYHTWWRTSRPMSRCGWNTQRSNTSSRTRYYTFIRAKTFKVDPQNSN